MKSICIFLALMLTTLFSFAQPHVYNYQGIARNTTGEPIANKKLGIKISIIKTDTNGVAVYEETHEPTTNNYGLFNLLIGTGNVVSGEVENIVWGADAHFIKVEIDPDGGSNYVNLGINQLASVPYAQQASSLNLFQNGTTNPDKMIFSHSPTYQNWGLLYNDNADVAKFIGGGIEVFNIDLSNKTIQYPHSSKGEGKVLVSDDEGTATWEDKKTKFTSINIPNCPSLSNVTTTMTKLANLGTFTKSKNSTFIQLDLATHFYIYTLTGGATGAIFELRINDTKTTLGNASYLVKTANLSHQGTITGIFPNLQSGNYTISIWVRTSFGAGNTAYIDYGCWNSFGTNSLIVKEFE